MEDLFSAVADSTRRYILERLRAEGPLSVSQLTESLPISRQAVTKHLDLLCASGVVHKHRVGRQRFHRLDPAPLQEIAAWLEPYAATWDRRLERLKRHLEEKK